MMLVLENLVRVAFLADIGAQPGLEFIKVDLVAVKLRTVHAGKLGLTANSDPAASAHPGAVQHDRVEADQGLDFEFVGDIAASLHHRHRTDTYSQSDILMLFQ